MKNIAKLIIYKLLLLVVVLSLPIACEESLGLHQKAKGAQYGGIAFSIEPSSVTTKASEGSVRPTVVTDSSFADIFKCISVVEGEPSTKAIDITTDNITTFVADAYYYNTTNPYFENYTFTGSGSPKVFSSASEPVWPDEAIDFYAYSEGGATGQVTKVARNSFTITPAATPAEQVDLVCATTYNRTLDNTTDGIVSLNFWHLLSQINVKVYNSSSSVKFQVLGWKIGNIYSSGTVTVQSMSTASHLNSYTYNNYITWSSYTGSDLSSYTSDFSSSPISVAASVASSSSIALPGDMSILPMHLVNYNNGSITAPWGEYASSSEGATYGRPYISVRARILTTSDVVLYNDIWIMYPFNYYEQRNSTKSTVSIDLGGGGYFETNQSGTNAGLDVIPTLYNTFVFEGLSVDVNAWPTATGTTINGPTATKQTQYSLTVSPTSASITYNGNTTLSASFQKRSKGVVNGVDPGWGDWNDVGGSYTINWTNGSSSYASVNSSGKVTGTNTGPTSQDVTITASVTYNSTNYSGTSTVTVGNCTAAVTPSTGNLYIIYTDGTYSWYNTKLSGKTAIGMAYKTASGVVVYHQDWVAVTGSTIANQSNGNITSPFVNSHAARLASKPETQYLLTLKTETQTALRLLKNNNSLVFPGTNKYATSTGDGNTNVSGQYAYYQVWTGSSWSKQNRGSINAVGFLVYQ